MNADNRPCFQSTFTRVPRRPLILFTVPFVRRSCRGETVTVHRKLSGQNRSRQRGKNGTVHFLRVMWQPTEFALEGLRNAKRVYEKTKRGRVRDTRQELHNPKRA